MRKRLRVRRWAVGAAGGMAAALVAVSAGAAHAALPAPDRVAGPDRIATAIALAQDSRPTGAATAVLARAGLYPDALAGSALAGFVGGPLLLTGGDRLDGRVAAELRRLAVERVALLGGTGALSMQVEADLRAAGVVEVDRVAGTDRFATAAAVAAEVGFPTRAFVVRGVDRADAPGWPDAVAASGLAAYLGAPLVLAGDTLPATSADVLRTLADNGLTQVTLVGGTAALPAAVEQQVRAAVPGASVDRAGGADRYATSVVLADRSLAAGLSASTTLLATGEKFPDALAAGPAASGEDGVLLLAPPQPGPGGGPTATWLDEHADKVGRLVLVGGMTEVPTR